MAVAFNVSLSQRKPTKLTNARMGIVTGVFNTASGGSPDISGLFKGVFDVVVSPCFHSDVIYHGFYSKSSNSFAVKRVNVISSSGATYAVQNIAAASAGSLSFPFTATGLI